MVEFVGRVNAIVFENNQDMFKILDVSIQGQLSGYSRDEIKVTGNFGGVQINSIYKFTGQLVMHDKFGLQFRVNSYKQVLPHQEGSLTKYLSSDKFPGIGKKAAETIIDELGLNALTILKENPAKISTLSLSQKQKNSLLSGINTMDSYSEIILKLNQFGINKRIANKIFQTYHSDAINKLEKNPYEPILDVTGYAFRTADNLGRELEFAQDAPERIQGAIFQVLLDALYQDGNTYVELKYLLEKTTELLGIVQYDLVADALNELQRAGKVIVNNEQAAMQKIFHTEEEIAQNLQRLVTRNIKIDSYSDKQLNSAIGHAEKYLKIKYDDTQKKAIKNAITHSISILTGGPGTGKTTIINGILLVLKELEEIPESALYSEDMPFLLAAPTGRAAKRMSEVTDLEAKTIHRLLGLGIGTDSVEDLNELNGDILIVDEMSMVDMFLFRQLVSNINETKHIVFVGDKDQLPSVGPGNVFSDLIKSQAFPTTRLTNIHRQGEDSSIVTLAHAINENKDPNLLFEKTKNYSFINCNPEALADATEKVVKHAINRGFAKDDIQVLSAMYHGNGGINQMNSLLQKIMNPKNPNAKYIEVPNMKFYIGDRVLQLQNNPEKEVYNGQIGKVIGINEKDSKNTLIANFDGNEVTYAKRELSDLTLAYAITIHKSQGSEFPVVILDLTMQNYVMLRRNLLYTAITRAEQFLIMLGQNRAFLMAVNTKGNDRLTGLSQKIVSLLKSHDKKENETKSDKIYELTPKLIYSGEIDPMIGMQNIKLAKRR